MEHSAIIITEWIDRRNDDMRSNHFRFPVRPSIRYRSDIYESLVSLRYKITRSPKLRWTSSYENNRYFGLQLDITCMVCLPPFLLAHTHICIHTYTHILFLSFLLSPIFIFFSSSHTPSDIRTSIHIHTHAYPIIVVNLNWLSKFDKSGTPWLSGIFIRVTSLLCYLLLDLFFFSRLYVPHLRISFYSNR